MEQKKNRERESNEMNSNNDKKTGKIFMISFKSDGGQSNMN